MSIKDLVSRYSSLGYARPVAENLAAEEIFLTILSGSEMADKVALKGGIVMFNLTKSQRRATRDIDFDFIRYSIDEDSIRLFFRKMAASTREYSLSVNGKIKPLHQEDYHGVRVHVRIQDGSSYGPLLLKLDIGVHNHLEIEQERIVFSFGQGTELTLQVNSPEQIFAEKCLSLSRLGALSTRYKDIYDLYYLARTGLNASKVLDILLTFFAHSSRQPKTIEDFKARVESALTNSSFAKEADDPKNRWLDVSYEEASSLILKIIASL